MVGWRAGAITVGVGVGAVALVRAALLVVRIDGDSMVPAYRSGDAVLALRRSLRPVRRGDVVVCRAPGSAATARSLLIKRVVAVAGDAMPETNEPPLTSEVPAGHVFVRGDGDRSLDSRQFGPIRVDRVVGRVVASLSRR